LHCIINTFVFGKLKFSEQATSHTLGHVQA